MKQRVVRLIAPPNVEKVWAAVALLGTTATWVDIYAVADFLKKRQLDAGRTRFDVRDPSTRYALEETPVRPRGWDDVSILTALSQAVDAGLMEMERRDSGYVFLAKPPSAHDLWKVQNTEIPSLPAWQAP